jgi:hypothetical protein
MPGTGIHISVMRHVAKALDEHGYAPPGSERVNPRWTGPDLTRLGRIMAEHDNFAALGAHGPDLFFLMPDFRDEGGIRVSSVLTFVLGFVEKVYDALDPFISKWEHYLGPISEDTAEEISRLTGGLSETFGDIGGELSAILTTALEDLATQHADLWEFFSLGLNKGYDDQAFFWSDIGHYRRTGAFGRALWEIADGPDGSDSMRAYALGYLTHLGTDTTAHSFVNAISGGPFRTHWQRHHLVENHMGALRYLQDPLGPGPQTSTTSQPISYGFLPPMTPASRRLVLSTVPPDARAEFLRSRERFERECCPLRVQFHASVGDLGPRDAAVLRLRQRVDGNLIGGYSVVLLPAGRLP